MAGRSLIILLLVLHCFSTAFGSSTFEFFLSDSGEDRFRCGRSASDPCRTLPELFQQIRLDRFIISTSILEIRILSRELTSFCGTQYALFPKKVIFRGNGPGNTIIGCNSADGNIALGLEMISSDVELILEDLSFGFLVMGAVKFSSKSNHSLSLRRVSVESQNYTTSLFQMSQGSITVEESEFRNLYFIKSSGVFNLTDGDALIVNSNFVNIKSLEASVIDARAMNIKINNSTFQLCATFKGSGGAILLRKISQLWLENSTFLSNSANSFGGAISLDIGCSGFSTNSKFFGMTAHSGGVIYLGTNSAWYDVGSTYSDNVAQYDGGAVFVDSFVSSQVFFSEVQFSHCFALGGKGGAIFVSLKNSMLSSFLLSISLSSFKFCTANGNGGAIGVDVRILSRSSLSNIWNFIDVQFQDCQSETGIGGAVRYLNTFSGVYSVLNFTNVSFQRCSAFGEGGGLSLQSLDSDFLLSFVNVSFSHCSSLLLYGGGILVSISSLSKNFVNRISFKNSYFENCNAALGGGGIYFDTSDNNIDLILENSSFSNCVAESGGGILLNSNNNFNARYFFKSLVFERCRGDKGGGISSSPLSNGSLIVIENSLFHQCSRSVEIILSSMSILQLRYSEFVENENSIIVFSHLLDNYIEIDNVQFYKCIGAQYSSAISISNLNIAGYLKLLINSCVFQNSYSKSSGILEIIKAGSGRSIAVTNNIFSECTSSLGRVIHVIESSILFKNNYLLDSNQILFETFSLIQRIILQLQNCSFLQSESIETGGALSIKSYGTFHISVEGNTFLNCSSSQRGGAIHYLISNSFSDNHVEVVNNVFQGCQSSDVGGAIHLKFEIGQDEVLIAENTFIETFSRSGGAVGIHIDSGVRLVNTTMKLNSFENSKSVLKGGAIYISDNGMRSNVVIVSSQFINCSSENEGGAVFISKSSNCLIFDSHFSNCFAKDGGALSIMKFLNLSIFKSVLFNNQARLGGAISFLGHSDFQSSFSISDSDFISNYAKSSAKNDFSCGTLDLSGSGGAIFFHGFHQNDIPSSISSSNFINNRADYFGGVIGLSRAFIAYNRAASDLDFGHLHMEDNVAGHWGDIVGSPLSRLRYWISEAYFTLGTPFWMNFELSDALHNIPRFVSWCTLFIQSNTIYSNGILLTILSPTLEFNVSSSAKEIPRIEFNVQFGKIQFLPRDLERLNATFIITIPSFSAAYPLMSGLYVFDKIPSLICASGHIPTFEKNNLVCRLCPAGTYVHKDEDGYLRCKACPIGSYSTKGSASCILCPAGKYSDNLRSIDCVKCSLGRFALNSGASSCDSCPSGMYGDVLGLSSCKRCLDLFTSEQTESFCRDCVHSKSGSESKFSCYCSNGFYGLPHLEEPCRPCQISPNVICNDNSSVPFISPGTFRTAENLNVAHICFPRESCQQTGSDLSTTCKEGYEGKKCGLCSKSYYRARDGTCKLCRLNFISISVPILQLLGLIALVDRNWRRRASARSEPLLLLILIVHRLQIIGMLPRTLKENESASQNGVESIYFIGSFLNIDFKAVSLECWWKMAIWPQYYLQALYPYSIALTYVLFQITFGEYLKRNLWYRRKFDVSPTSVRFRRVFLTIYSVFLASSLEAVLRPLQCFKQDDSSFTMMQYPSKDCFTREWFSHLPFILSVIFVLCVGVPYFLVREFWLHRRKAYFDQRFLNIYGILLHPYKPGYFYWSVADLLPRMLIVFLVIFSSQLIIGLRIYLLLLMFFSVLISERFLEPYSIRFANTVSHV